MKKCITFTILFMLISVGIFSGCVKNEQQRIIFQSVRDAPVNDPDILNNTQKYFELYTMNADGSDVKRLTYNSYWENQAAYSPDGTKIVFGIHYNASRLNEADPGWEIAMMNADGSHMQRLTNNDYLDFQPHFNHNATKIVYTSDTAKLTAEDFKHINKTKTPPQYDIYTMNPDGLEKTQLTFGEPGEIYADPSFSFNEPSKIVYIHSQNLTNYFDIYIMDEDGSHKQLVLAHNEELHAFNDPMFSPDGKKIIFSARLREDSDLPIHNIFMVNIDGTNLTRITQDDGESDVLPMFSFDGSRICYMTYVPEENGHTHKIRVANVNGSQEQIISSYPWEAAPSWVPTQN
jgi:Tol biopolymer transport system component